MVTIFSAVYTEQLRQTELTIIFEIFESPNEYLHLPSAVLAPEIGHTMNELSSSDCVFCEHENPVQCCIQSTEICCPSTMFLVYFFRDPGVVPSIICFSKLSALLFITCPKYVNFLAFADLKRFTESSASFNSQSFVRFAVHDTRSLYLAKSLHFECLQFFWSPARIFQLSQS